MYAQEAFNLDFGGENQLVVNEPENKGDFETIYRGSTEYLEDIDFPEYTMPDHYIIYDDVPENNTTEQANDAVNIKIVNTETGAIKEVFYPKEKLPEGFTSDELPVDLYKALAEKVKLEMKKL
ncbi:hypothetical protein CL684_01855 [Candidatus Campbellbacteria bacterium]|nr:hypothetical protein [Candidatus Campbellbacteria bacterium]|tara:strand:+ start:612 stop:980 length:369 start_codon:yes stop_codon:yes gene_type:complete